MLLAHMGPYLFASAFLTGFFAFGAVYHLILWLTSRRERVLLVFVLVALVVSIQSYAVLSVAVATTVEEGQKALDLRSSGAILTVISLAWLFSAVSNVRAGWYLWSLTTVFLIGLAYSLIVSPMTGVVTAVEPVVTPWGETVTVLHRTSTTAWLQPLYALALSVPVFGGVVARHTWTYDRVGAVLVAVTAAGYLATIVVALLIDVTGSLLPYPGPMFGAMWILPIAWQVARGNRLRDQMLAATERRFRAIFDQTFQFIGLLDVEGNLLEANQTALEFAGLKSEDVIGKPFWETPWWTHSPALQQQVRDAIREAGRGEVVRFEATHRDRDGEMHHIDVSLKPVYDANGAVVLLIPEGRDITNRVVAEETKRKLEQQLLQAQKMEALGQLAGGVAHDFNNLLTVIAGHTDMLLLEKGDQPARHDLEQIRRASERAASMTRQLLAFSRQSVLEPKVVNLNTVVAQMESMLRRSIGEHIDLIVQAAPDVALVKADPDQLARALLNLALNARDAMPNGGTLVIETRNAERTAESGASATGSPARDVLLAMSDTGCGMTAETKARLFEPFYTTKDQGRGTGLGLAVVDGIVKQSGGRIDVSSDPSAGTTFRIFLPAADAQDMTHAEPSDGPPPRGTETVLLVEDEPAVREITQAALQRHGYTVLPAASGVEALRIARANQGVIKVVLTDVVMPGMSGPQLVERLREYQPDLAALFMSGYMSDAVLRHGIATGEADFLQKPFSTSALAAKLRQVLDR